MILISNNFFSFLQNYIFDHSHRESDFQSRNEWCMTIAARHTWFPPRAKAMMQGWRVHVRIRVISVRNKTSFHANSYFTSYERQRRESVTDYLHVSRILRYDSLISKSSLIFHICFVVTEWFRANLLSDPLTPIACIIRFALISRHRFVYFCRRV